MEGCRRSSPSETALHESSSKKKGIAFRRSALYEAYWASGRTSKEHISGKPKTISSQLCLSPRATRKGAFRPARCCWHMSQRKGRGTSGYPLPIFHMGQDQEDHSISSSV